VTLAAGRGVDAESARAEVQSTHAYAELTDAEWNWALDFVRGGGPSLAAYPDYRRVEEEASGTWGVPDRRLERRHRMGIGTIVADASVAVRFGNGKRLGSIEESFVARLVPGDRFVFAGRVLELVRLREMTATVRTAKTKRGIVPRWNGGKMPLSSHLSEAVRRKFDEAARGEYEGPEMQAVRPLLERQRESSRIPRMGETLVEVIRTRDGFHVFLFTFAGRAAHEGMGAVLAHRLTRRSPSTVRATVTDYGIELFSEDAFELDQGVLDELFAPGDLAGDLVEALHGAELARRQFREIARIAGLTFQGFPGNSKPVRHLQASSNMFYDVFRDFDPGNLLLSQAQREVLEGQLEFERLAGAMRRAREEGFVIERPDRLTPLAFPLWAETMRSTQTSSESWEKRVRRMAAMLEAPGTASGRADG
jgi:ATP-dependent Lhr-like helicase